MSFKFKNSYLFAFKTACAISLIILLIIGFILWINSSISNLYVELISLAGFVFVISFLMIQLRIESLLYNKIKTLYEELDLIDQITFTKSNITSDMNSLLENISEFTKDKKLEIETLKSQEEFRKEFIGNIAHELKTPIFTIQGYVENLIDGAIDDKKLRNKFLTRTNVSVERLIYIIKDLDMITKLESGIIETQNISFDIIELIKKIFDQLEIQAHSKGIKLLLDKQYENPVLVFADKDKIHQVLINLIINSIKYGTQKGTTEISIDFINEIKILIRVTDNGEGISEENQSRVFERFFRVDQSGSRKQGGSGLGLSIVKHIIDAHNENIYLTSKLGIGSEFSFTLNKKIN